MHELSPSHTVLRLSLLSFQGAIAFILPHFCFASLVTRLSALGWMLLTPVFKVYGQKDCPFRTSSCPGHLWCTNPSDDIWHVTIPVKCLAGGGEGDRLW